MHLCRSFDLAAVALALVPAVARADDARIVVHHVAGLDAAERADVRADADTQLERTMRLPDTEVVSVTEGTRAQALAALRRDPDVAWAETDDPVSTFTNDMGWSQLWGMFNPGNIGRVDADIDVEQAWTQTRGAGITVGVVDTGVQASHTDLTGRVATGYNAVNGGTDTTDAAGHGTHVAGSSARPPTTASGSPASPPTRRSCRSRSSRAPPRTSPTSQTASPTRAATASR